MNIEVKDKQELEVLHEALEELYNLYTNLGVSHTNAIKKEVINNLLEKVDNCSN